MTLEEAKSLDGKTPMRFKVTSIKIWKRNPFRVEVRVKRGLYQYAIFNELEIEELVRKGE